MPFIPERKIPVKRKVMKRTVVEVTPQEFEDIKNNGPFKLQTERGTFKVRKIVLGEDIIERELKEGEKEPENVAVITRGGKRIVRERVKVEKVVDEEEVEEIYPKVVGKSIVPSIIANPHCVTGDTLVTLRNGLAKRIDSMRIDGPDMVWGWDKQKKGLKPSKQFKMFPQGEKEILKLTFQDGRELFCTPDHKILTINKGEYKWIQAQDLVVKGYYNDKEWIENKEASEIMMGIEGVEDNPTKQEREIEEKWELVFGDYDFNMTTEDDRQRSLAFARLLGLILTDGTVSKDQRGETKVNIYLGHQLDIDVALEDIKLILGESPKVHRNDCYVIYLPYQFSQSISKIEGISIGKRISQVTTWPKFILDSKCPKSIVREFLGGLFGGDGQSPYMVKANKNHCERLLGIHFSQSIFEIHKEGLYSKFEQLAKLLSRFDIESIIEGPYSINCTKGTIKPKDWKENSRIEYYLRINDITRFSKEISFRYCIQKTCKTSFSVAYHRYVQNVKRQHNQVVKRALSLYDNNDERIFIAQNRKSLSKALELARKELLEKEGPLNIYYSLSSLQQLQNRHRANRCTELQKLDYKYIENPKQFFESIGCLEWFLREEDNKMRYIVKHGMDFIPGFKMKLIDKRSWGKDKVYDISVEETHSFIANGLVISNCIPSRMTSAKLIEIMASKLGTMTGEKINATSFRPFDIDELRRLLKEYGFSPSGTQAMISGETGKLLQVEVFVGVCYYQAQRHIVKHKVTQCSGPKWAFVSLLVLSA